MTRIKLLAISATAAVMILGSSLVIAAQPATDNGDEVVSSGTSTSTEQLGVKDAPRRGGGGAGGGTLKK